MKKLIISLLVITAPLSVHAQQRIEPTIMPPPPPPSPNPANYGPWPVGLWVPSAKPCSTALKFDGAALRFSKNGSYSGPKDSGDWKIVGTSMVFGYRDLSQWNGEMVTNDIERISPVKTRHTPFARRPDGSLLLGGVAWKRCSRDPDATEGF